MSHCGKIVGVALLLMAGCSTTPPQRPVELTVVPDSQVVIAAPKEINLPAPAPANTSVNAPPSAVAHTTPPGLTASTNHFPETWVSLDRWSRYNGFGAPKRIPADDTPTFAVATTNGQMTIKVGSQLAHWDGLECHLGFRPEIINGHPYLHTLDIQKNLEPLMNCSLEVLSRNRVLVIDPGHGGMDSGTTNVFNGRFEKEFTLDWARRLQSLLNTNGWTVFLTRTNDMNIPLARRVAFANEHKADLFLSLHFNSSFPDHAQAGLETYCLTPAGMPSNLTRGFPDNSTIVFPNNAFDAQNLQYAVRLHRALLKVSGNADRGVRRARFLGVLQGQHRPAVLVEGGYLSNPREARRIADPAYREKLAEALARALLDSCGNEVNLAAQSTPNPPPSRPDGKVN